MGVETGNKGGMAGQPERGDSAERPRLMAALGLIWRWRGGAGRAGGRIGRSLWVALRRFTVRGAETLHVQRQRGEREALADHLREDGERDRQHGCRKPLTLRCVRWRCRGTRWHRRTSGKPRQGRLPVRHASRERGRAAAVGECGFWQHREEEKPPVERRHRRRAPWQEAPRRAQQGAIDRKPFAGDRDR